MTEPVFFIEGHMEQRFLQKLCSRKKVLRIGTNGDAVTMRIMAKHLAPQIRLLNNRHHPIVILFDRERREDSCVDLKASLEVEIRALGITDTLIIGIADRTIENWILADYNSIAIAYGLEKSIVNFEGTFGKSKLKNHLPEEINYQETSTGVNLLLASSPQNIYDNSESFKMFIDSFNFSCWWTDQIIK